MTAASLVPSPPSSTRARNPWLYVGAGFIALLVGVNTMNILFNVLTPSLTEEFGWDRLQISSGLSLFTVFDGIGLFALGFLIDRFGVRRVAIPMAAIFGGGIVALSASTGSLPLFYALCAVVGAGAGAATATVYSIVISAWFESRRGLALGILNVGLGLCGTIMPFIIGGLLDVLGWRGVFVAIGVLCAGIPVMMYGFVIRMPEEWERARRDAVARGRMAGAPMREIMSHRHFWLICLSIFLISAATFGVLSQVVAMTTDRGIDTGTALAVLSTVSLSSIGSRVLVGFLLDRIWAPLLTAIIFVLCGVGVAIITMSDAIPLLYMGAVLIGLGLGAEGDIAAYIVSRYVPASSYARVFGIVMFLYAQGGAVGILILSVSITQLGSYAPAAWLIILMVAASAAAALALGPYLYRTDGSAASDAAPADTGEHDVRVGRS